MRQISHVSFTIELIDPNLPTTVLDVADSNASKRPRICSHSLVSLLLVAQFMPSSLCLSLAQIAQLHFVPLRQVVKPK